MRCLYARVGALSMPSLVAAVSAAFFVASCGGSDGGSAVPVARPADLEESLTLLGVNTDTSVPRRDSQGNDYPETYAPLGQRIVIRQIDPVASAVSASAVDEPIYIVGRPEELFLGGARVATRAFSFTAIDDISIAGLSDAQAQFSDPVVLEGRPLVETPWAVEPPSSVNDILVAGTRRDTAALDADGDGFLEAATVYALELSGGSGELRLQIVDGDALTPNLDFALLTGGNALPAYDVRVAATDLDADGRDELAIALAGLSLPGVVDTPVQIYVVDDALAGYAVIASETVSFSSVFVSPVITLDIEAVHSDHDNQDEFALVVQASDPLAPRPGRFESTFYVFELDGNGLTTLAEGPIVANVPADGGTTREASAVVANVEAGDIDGDGIDELLFAGFEDVVESCVSQDAGTDLGTPYLLAVYGGRYNDYSPIGGSAAEISPPCTFESGSQSFAMRWAHLNVLDFDGDGDADIHINDRVFDSIPARDWDASLVAFFNDPLIIYGRDVERRYFDRSDTVFAVSDQTGDGVDDLVYLYTGFVASLADLRPFLQVLAYDAADSDGYSLATRVAIDERDQTNGNVMLVPMDVDNDKVALLEYTGDFFLDITEPIVLAAIAGAPCKRDIGQDSCYSTWGSTQSGAIGRDFSVKVFGSAGAGAGAAGAGALGKWLVKVSASAALTESASYELSQSQTFSTGPFEDGVVFTSIPVDRYAYELIRDNTDQGGKQGERLEIRLPRSPGIRIVSREYYNASITGDAEPIDERVFAHVTGDVSSYPTALEKDLILQTQRSVLEDFRAEKYASQAANAPVFDIVPALIGLEVGPVLVGEGGGATELALEYTETLGLANELTLGVSFEAEMLAGVAIEWEAGIEAGRTLSISHGDSTLFSGSVDSIDRPFYAQEFYAFGLFVYVQNLGDREIEVINFWVEED